MTNKTTINIVWLRRDLRLHDNRALYEALKSRTNVQLLFIFDSNILDELSKDDKRVAFIYNSLKEINAKLFKLGTSLLVEKGNPIDVFNGLLKKYNVESIYCNHDYEPYSIKRDSAVSKLAVSNNAGFYSFKDHAIFEKNEVVKENGKPYTVFTPYSKKWLNLFEVNPIETYNTSTHFKTFNKSSNFKFPDIDFLGFSKTDYQFPGADFNASILVNYENNRDYPSVQGTSKLGMHLRFGTVSIREAVLFALNHSRVWLKQLIWRDFFMMILWHFPYVENNSFNKKYNNIEWVNDSEQFEMWCNGQTGYPIVDAGMRELLATGYMHNRVRMVTASFLTKHLLIDWRWGEAFFAKHLLDYELSSNNGNWQWAASTGCDAVPYFRIFNPILQAKKFDKANKYINHWVPELNSGYYKPIVNHEYARQRALQAYKNVY